MQLSRNPDGRERSSGRHQWSQEKEALGKWEQIFADVSIGKD
jgi:hypothetical protein